jgi:hypothetical protein
MFVAPLGTSPESFPNLDRQRFSSPVRVDHPNILLIKLAFVSCLWDDKVSDFFFNGFRHCDRRFASTGATKLTDIKGAIHANVSALKNPA